MQVTRIGLITDVHSTPEPVAEALEIFRREGVGQVWCAGDIAGYRQQLDETVDLLIESGCHCILGNHDLMYLSRVADKPDDRAARFLRELPRTREETIEGKRLYMVHAQPPAACNGGIKLLNRDGELKPEQASEWAGKLAGFGHDVLIVGHTHQLFAEQLGDTLVINPGSSAFNYSCAILDLPTLKVTVFPLLGKRPVKCWNWAEHVVYGD